LGARYELGCGKPPDFGLPRFGFRGFTTDLKARPALKYTSRQSTVGWRWIVDIELSPH
jgi:hypothetical protein